MSRTRAILEAIAVALLMVAVFLAIQVGSFVLHLHWGWTFVASGLWGFFVPSVARWHERRTGWRLFVDRP